MDKKGKIQTVLKIMVQTIIKEIIAHKINTIINNSNCLHKETLTKACQVNIKCRCHQLIWIFKVEMLITKFQLLLINPNGKETMIF